MTTPLKIVLFGPPGSGKGTQAELLSERLGFVHYSTGEAFRTHIARKTPIGLEVERFVTTGLLVPDEIVLRIVKAFLDEHIHRPIVFDGFPRTIVQAQGLDRVLTERGLTLTWAILIDLSDDEVVRRLSSRRQCRNCSRIYNLTFMPPQRDGICDDCGGELYQRTDDSEKTIRDRLRVYQNETSPLIDYYQQQGKLVRIDGALGRDRVYESLKQLLAANR